MHSEPYKWSKFLNLNVDLLDGTNKSTFKLRVFFNRDSKMRNTAMHPRSNVMLERGNRIIKENATLVC